MASFVDEYIKIAASTSESKSPKTRIGRRPIRADNLLKKADVKTEAVLKGGEIVRRGLLPFLGRQKKNIALLGAGAAGGKALEEYAVEPMELGYRVMRARGEI
jgi:hypothetical protein